MSDPCRGLYPCDDCGDCPCNCECRTDGAPQTRAESTAGHVNPTQARLDAWQTKQELTR